MRFFPALFLVSYVIAMAGAQGAVMATPGGTPVAA